MHTLAFILGREPALSLAEIKAVFENHSFDFTFSYVSRDVALIKSRHVVDAHALMEELGGTIKIGTVLPVLKGTTPDPAELVTELRNAARAKKGKFSFGISGYGVTVPVRLGLECKRLLREGGVSARYVEGRGAALTAPQIKNYKLDSEGAELLLIKTNNGVAVAHMQAVQPFERFSERDYGRPGRDAKSGMLPPKVARMMVNLAQCPHHGLLIDPFCGSGTILTEAALMGYTHIAGSDISEKAVNDTLKNIAWVVKKRTEDIVVKKFDARRIAELFQKNSVSAVVTEPLLGPPLKGRENEKRIRDVGYELKKLYLDSLRALRAILKKNGRVVLIVPALRFDGGWISPLTQHDFEKNEWFLEEPLPVEYLSLLQKEKIPLPALWWHRPDQRLGRQIIILKKNS
ncbi:MAG TPA: hypothetical protein DDW36_01360 [Candidatus Magasanikbacteria bacterium]|nr:hypothetical protein [Candidatus Magasanikbacteria bacterium]